MQFTGTYRKVQDNRYAFNVVNQEGAWVSYMEVSIGDNSALIEDLSVFEAFQRRGIAENMINFLLHWEHTKDLVHELLCYCDNYAGLNLYAKCGFHKVTIVPRLGGFGEEENLWMLRRENVLAPEVTLKFREQA